MNGKFRNHLDALFSEAPDNRKTVEIKEEILQNLCAKYNDLISQGKSEEAAYNIAIAGIGDISDLIGELNEKTGEPPGGESAQSLENYRRRSAFVSSIAVMMYILSVVPVILLGGSDGVILFFVIIAGATGLLVYDSQSKPGWRKDDKTMAEEFRKWRESSSKNRNVMQSISSAIWGITLALYFVVSFVTGAWYVTWVIFLIAGAINNSARRIGICVFSKSIENLSL